MEPFDLENDLEKTWLTLKMSYLRDKHFRNLVSLGRMLRRIDEIMKEEGITVIDPEFSLSAPLSPEGLPDRISSNSSGPIRRRPHNRERRYYPDFPDVDTRRKVLEEFLTIEPLTLEEAIQNVRNALKVPIVRDTMGPDHLRNLIVNDIYQMRMSNCLEINGEGKDKQFKFIPGRIPSFRHGKGTAKKRETP